MLDRRAIGPPAAGTSVPDEPTMKLGKYFHLEWCPSCVDWRPQGHSQDERQHRAATAAGLQEEEADYPTIG